MTIKELNEFMLDHGFCNTDNKEDLPKKYVCDLIESAIKDGYYKAIDEFAELLKGNLIRKYANATLTQQYVALQVTDWCNEIAEQMKAGAK